MPSFSSSTKSKATRDPVARPRSNADAWQASAQVIEALTDPACLKDLRGRIVAKNHAFSDLVPASAVIAAANDRLRPFSQPELDHLLRANERHVIDTGIPCHFGLSTDNDQRFVVDIRPLRSTLGAAIGLIEVFRMDTRPEGLPIPIELREEVTTPPREIVRMGMWSVDLGDGKAFWSQELRDLFEVDLDPGQPALQQFLNLVHPEERETVTKVYEAIVRGSAPSQVSFRSNPDLGPVRLFASTIQIDKNAAGQAVSAIGSIVEVTERQEVRSALRKSEERFSTIFHRSPIGIGYGRFGGAGFTDINDRYAEFFGYRREEFLDMKVAPLWVDAALRERVLEKLLAEGAVRDVEAEFRHRSGSTRWGLVNLEMLDIEEEPVILGMIVDITDRKSAEEAVRDSEGRLRTIIETEPECVKLVAPSGELLGMNPAGLEMIEAEVLNDVLGRDVSQLVDPKYRRTYQQLQTNALRGVAGKAEYEIVGLKGTRRIVEAHAVPLREPDGSISAVLSVTRDVTRNRQAEAEIRRLNADLEKRVEERTRQMESANRELEAFCYSVSHDLRTPLRAISGFSAALIEDCGQELSEEGKDYLSRIAAGTERMTSMINDLLRLSRVSRGEIKLESVDLSQIARAHLDELARLEPERNIRLEIEEGLVATADAGLARVLLGNLLDNAWKFTGQTPEPWISVGSRMEADQRVFLVQDNGAGFDMAHSAKLFGVFERLHRSGEFAGSGIGLATAQRIVHRHGGRIWAEAEVDKGATVFFTLPEP